MRKNGWHYEVWGTSEDPSSWFEQNITLLGKGQQTPQRQMKRIKIPNEINVIVEQVKSAKELSKRHGEQFYDFFLPQSRAQVSGADGIQMMQMGGGGGFGGKGL